MSNKTLELRPDELELIKQRRAEEAEKGLIAERARENVINERRAHETKKKNEFEAKEKKDLEAITKFFNELQAIEANFELKVEEFKKEYKVEVRPFDDEGNEKWRDENDNTYPYETVETIIGTGYNAHIVFTGELAENPRFKIHLKEKWGGYLKATFQGYAVSLRGSGMISEEEKRKYTNMKTVVAKIHEYAECHKRQVEAKKAKYDFTGRIELAVKAKFPDMDVSVYDFRGHTAEVKLPNGLSVKFRLYDRANDDTFEDEFKVEFNMEGIDGLYNVDKDNLFAALLKVESKNKGK